MPGGADPALHGNRICATVPRNSLGRRVNGGRAPQSSPLSPNQLSPAGESLGRPRPPITPLGRPRQTAASTRRRPSGDQLLGVLDDLANQGLGLGAQLTGWTGHGWNHKLSAKTLGDYLAKEVIRVQATQVFNQAVA